MKIPKKETMEIKELEKKCKKLQEEKDAMHHLWQDAEKKKNELNHLYLHYKTRFSPGHFYSPIPDLKYVMENEATLFAAEAEVLGIDLNTKRQYEYMTLFSELYYDVDAFPADRTGERRYYYLNPAYGFSDAFFLHSFLRTVKPKRVIEVGSGYSSAMMLDTNEFFLDNSIEYTFIEPYPELLHSVMTPTDREVHRIIDDTVQSVPLEVFSQLEENDILFIDSTHVSKTGSDVNYLYFEVLPRLQPGVFIHIHDIFYPFMYPKPWVEEGRAWNETYLLRALLMDSDRFEIQFWNHYMQHSYPDEFQKAFPLANQYAGASLWLKSV